MYALKHFDEVLKFSGEINILDVQRKRLDRIVVKTLAIIHAEFEMPDMATKT